MNPNMGDPPVAIPSDTEMDTSGEHNFFPFKSFLHYLPLLPITCPPHCPQKIVCIKNSR